MYCTLATVPLRHSRRGLWCERGGTVPDPFSPVAEHPVAGKGLGKRLRYTDDAAPAARITTAPSLSREATLRRRFAATRGLIDGTALKSTTSRRGYAKNCVQSARLYVRESEEERVLIG